MKERAAPVEAASSTAASTSSSVGFDDAILFDSLKALLVCEMEEQLRVCLRERRWRSCSLWAVLGKRESRN